jgi:large subunit ribosomal protein L22
MEAVAKLRNSPISPRKVRLVADMVRKMEVTKALDVLQHSPKHASIIVRKLLLSAIDNWKRSHEAATTTGDGELFVKYIYVDEASMLKRFQPAPQGRAHRIRRRSNHTTVVVGKREK